MSPQMHKPFTSMILLAFNFKNLRQRNPKKEHHSVFHSGPKKDTR